MHHVWCENVEKLGDRSGVLNKNQTQILEHLKMKSQQAERLVAHMINGHHQKERRQELYQMLRDGYSTDSPENLSIS